MTDRLYLDHNASSPIRPDVETTIFECVSIGGNASAQHQDGQSVRRLIERAREAIGLDMGVCAQDIIFTGSGTEADNMAIYSAVQAGCKRLLISAMDHPATIKAADAFGEIVEFIPANEHGQTDTAWLKAKLESWDATDGRPFVSIVAANSETGVIQDIETAIELTQAHGGLILVDAVQAFGKIPMVGQPDYLVVSAHKVAGPQGVGALYVAPDAPFTSLIHGGGQERNRRAGTMNMLGIAGFGAAMGSLDPNGYTSEARDYLEVGLKAMEPELTIFGECAERLPNTSFFAIPDTSSMTLMMSLDLNGVSVSTGTACSSGKVGASRAITAMGLGDKAPKGAIRVSFGHEQTEYDAEKFLRIWAMIRKKNYAANDDIPRYIRASEF